jgi:hypothetical protein
MSFIYCHLNFHANLLRPWRFPLNKNILCVIHCKLYTVKSAQVIPFRPRLFKWRNIVLSSAHQHSNDSNNGIVLCECIVQRRYLFFVKLCFDNIMSIIMKISYMKSNNFEQYTWQRRLYLATETIPVSNDYPRALYMWHRFLYIFGKI